MNTAPARQRILLGLFLTGLGLLSALAKKSPEPESTEGGLQLNELLAANQSGLRDDEGNTNDWLELKNSSSQSIELTGYHLTNDLEDLEKWRFSEGRVSAGAHVLVWMSGRSGKALAPAEPTATVLATPYDQSLIGAEAKWKYFSLPKKAAQHSPDIAFPSDWMNLNFDDRSFSLGQAGFGYGDEDDTTLLNTGTTVVLLRHEFVLAEEPSSNSLVLEIDYDDGFVAYLNGQRVAARNAPREEINQESVATVSHDAGAPERIDLSAHVKLLRIGKNRNNVLAIAGLNNSSSSSDLSLNPTLGTLPIIRHANFRLSKKGGSLYLVSPEGQIIDQVEYPRQEEDQSLGWSATNPPSWGYFLTPTPGTANTGKQLPEPIKSRLSLNPDPGGYEHPVALQIQSDASRSLEIRYTQDGTTPIESSNLYDSPIHLDKPTLIRTAAFAAHERVGPIVSGTYLVRQNSKLPVLAISMNPADFSEVQLQTRATGHTSERPAFMEYFEPNGQRTAATGFGLRLHGGAGRNGGFNTKKSYRTYFRKTYGKGRLGGWIIPEAEVKNFDQLVLRASSNDRAFHGSSIRDQVIRDLHADMGALASRGSWCVLRINSENRGVYNISERMNEDFLASHLGPGDFDIIKTGETILSGDREGWDDLRRFVTRTDFSDDANFEALSQRVDIENLTSYVIVNLSLQNFDWPHNNWYAARRVPDGKWIFLCWDSEWGLGYRHPGLGDAPYGIDVDPYAFIDSGGAYSNSLIRNIFLALINHPQYRDYYQQEVKRHLRGPLSTDNIMRHIHRHRDAIAHDIGVEYAAKGQNLNRWHDQINEVEHFARNSPAFFQKHTNNYFSHQSAPSDGSRLAIIEDSEGRLHVHYRKSNGQLRELSSSVDTRAWTDKPITTQTTAPSAAGSPSVFSLSKQNRRLLYRGEKGHLHELSLSGRGANDEIWKHIDLTSLLQLPPASSDPSVITVDKVPHLVFVDEKAHAHELWFDKNWHHHPLPVTPRPANGVMISATEGTLHVTYRTLFGVPCEQILSLSEASQGRRYWTHRLTQRIPSQGQPIGVSINGKWRLIFQPVKTWPLAEPFIFHWNGALRKGYQEYDGPRNGLIQAWNNRQRFHHLEPIGNPSAPAESIPLALHDKNSDHHYIAYRDTKGHIQEARLTSTEPLPSSSEKEAWQIDNLTTLADAPPATGELSGLIAARTGDRHYIYEAQGGTIHQLHFNGLWMHRNLTEAVAKPSE